MCRTLIGKELRDIKWKLFVAFLVLVASIVLMIILHERLLELLPADMSEIPFFISPDMFNNFRDFTNAMWSNLNDQNLPQIGSLLAIILGIGLLAPEIESGTITLLLTNGISRQRVFWTKSILAVGALILLLVVVGILVVPLSSAFGYSLRHFRIIPATLVAALGIAFVFSVSLLISLILKERIWSGIVSAVVFALWSILGFWEATRVFSPFYHMRARDYFYGDANFPWLAVVGFIAATIAVLLVAERRFAREEL